MKLDLACGGSCSEGYEGVDIAPLPGVKHVMDILSFPWPFASDSVDEIHTSHFIEHVPMMFWCPPIEVRDDDGKLRASTGSILTTDQRPGSIELLLKFFDEVYRVLKPGGSCQVVCPQAHNNRAFQDPSHRRFIVPETFMYLDAKWRAVNKLTHGAYAVSCDFPIDGEFGTKLDFSALPETQALIKRMHPTAVRQRIEKEWNFVEDIVAKITKPSKPRA